LAFFPIYQGGVGYIYDGKQLLGLLASIHEINLKFPHRYAYLAHPVIPALLVPVASAFVPIPHVVAFFLASLALVALPTLLVALLALAHFFW
jgi:hypothetical protein